MHHSAREIGITICIITLMMFLFSSVVRVSVPAGPANEMQADLVFNEPTPRYPQLSYQIAKVRALP